MFRDVLLAIPEILQGNMVVVREELVPFFNFSSQFWPESTSALTSSEEIRVVYSFWTSWVRHYAVLPFALVLLNTISAFVLFYAFYRIGRFFAGRRVLSMVLAAALAAFLIHFILLYAKVTHFYTLVFGFSLFALAMSFMLEQLFFKRDLSKRNIIFVTLLVLLNPAIHYHVIFYFIFAFFVLMQIGFTFVLNRAHTGFYLKRNLLYFGIVVAASLLPYAAFILIAGGSATSSAATNIPINYWMIYYSSIPLTSLFSLDTAAQVDMFRYGVYLIPSPRIFTMIAMFLIGSIFIMRQWKELHIAKRVFLIALFVGLLLTAWMAMGYSENNNFSFHSIVGAITMYLTDQANAFAQAAGQAIATFVNILRFPHRFQFIFFYLAGVLLMIGLLWAGEAMRRRRSALLATLIVIVMALSPVFIARDYFLVLTSGDFATFLRPYRISPDLKHIKGMLAEQQGETMFILPTLESGRDLHADNHRHGFIDKFLIYYLDQPTLYYGTGGDPEHKAIAYTVYRAIEDGEPWWEDLLVYSLGITRILQPKQTSERPVGFSYMPGVEKAINDRLLESSLFEKTYDGNDFALFEAREQPSNRHVLLDMQWDELTRRLGEHAGDHLYFPLQLGAFAQQEGDKYLWTDSVERSFYDIYAARKPHSTFYPNTAKLAFSKNLVASSSFTVNALSMSTLNSKHDEYNYIGERMPSLLGTLSAQFIGVAAGNEGLTVRINAPQDGAYRLLLHAASPSEKIIGAVDNQGTILHKIADDQGRHQDFIDMTYFYADVQLSAGNHSIELHNPGNSGLAIEALSLVPEGDLPASFTGSIDQPVVHLAPAGTEGMYTIEFKEEL